MKSETSSKMPENELKILLVEDDPIDILSITRTLTRLNPAYKIEAVSDGKEAVRLLNRRYLKGESLPDVLLLDLDMPEMDGLLFLQTLKQDNRFSDIPAFVFSGTEDPKKKKTVLDMEIQGFYQKPTSFHKYTATLEEISTRWRNYYRAS